MASYRRVHPGLAVAGVAAVTLFGWAIFHKKPAPKRPPPPVTAVSVAKVSQRDVPVTINAIGTAQGWQAVTVRAQANGRLLRVDVREGGDVRQGQVIAQIDPSPYRAALMQAEGALRRDQAQLELAKLNLERFKKLASQDSIALVQVDTQEALVKQFEGSVLLDRGQVAAAQVNLGFTQIRAPVSGRVGVRLVDAGNLVSTTDPQGIVTINQVSPIAVVFTVPQGEFQRLVQATDGFRRPLRAEAYSQETGVLLDSGQVEVVDNRIDPQTATVQLKARFNNQTHKLWPGQALNVKLVLSNLSNAIALPSAAVSNGPRGTFTYVVNKDKKAELRPLEIETIQGPVTVIRSGVKPGETVVVDGQLGLRPDAKVSIRPATARPVLEPPGGVRPNAGRS
jgi:multidrug efflux system membrane fusion protein